MKRATRRTIFYFLLTVFLVTTPLLVLYAVGYSFNLAKLSLARTGGFFVKTNVSGVSLYVNGALAKETNFLSSGALVNGLAPGMVTVEITKEGYRPWKKSIVIEEQLIQEFRKAVLIPDTLPVEQVFGTTSPRIKNDELVARDLLLSPDGSSILYVTDDGASIFLRIFDRNGRLLRSTMSLPEGTEYIGAEWNREGSALLLSTSIRERKSWQIVYAAPREPSILFAPHTVLHAFTTGSAEAISRTNIKEIAWGNEENTFLIQAASSIYHWDTGTQRVRKLLDGVYSFMPFEDGIVYATPAGFIARASLDGATVETIDRPGFFMKDRPLSFSRYKNGYAFLDSNGGVYFQAETNKFVPLDGNYSKMKIAPDNPLLGYANTGSFSYVLLEDERYQPFRKKYVSAKVFESKAPILDFIWFGEDATHVIYQTSEAISIAENDTRFGSLNAELIRGQFIIAADPRALNSFYIANGTGIERITIPE